jgi:hypothetical protein
VAYNTPFVGNAAIDFVTFLHDIDNDILHGKFPAYAKAISVLQSSGTGKSRMLTEVRPYSVGRHHLTESLLGWQIHLHASHLSSPSTFSRLPTI